MNIPFAPSQDQAKSSQTSTTICRDSVKSRIHYESTSTTFSTESTESSAKSSAASIVSSVSSGVVTMSSTDQLKQTSLQKLSITSATSYEASSNVSPTCTPVDLGCLIESNEGNVDDCAVDFVSSKTVTPPSPPTTGLHVPNPSPRAASRASQSSFPLTVSPLFSAENAKDMICVPLRMIVSQNRRRFTTGGFNLDLTYITDRIIAMGYPADTAESLYRNNMKHIVKFLEKFHPGYYKVFNLRGQYAYDEKNFHYRVVSYEMKDHHPPRLELMAPFCREVHDHLLADPHNVVAVHCKAGKGRTGVMICAYLYYINFFENPRQIMDYYSIVRTHNNKGVTIPSQRRYIYYFSHLRDKQLNYMPLKVELVGVYLERPPRTGGFLKKGSLVLRVANGDVDVFHGMELSLTSEQYDEEDEMWRKYPVMKGDDSFDYRDPESSQKCISRRCYGWTVPPNKRVFLEGDIRVDILSTAHKIPFFSGKADKIGHIWFNTMFTCSSSCGSVYIHGDEAYPYLENGEPIVTSKRKTELQGIPKSCSVSEKRIKNDIYTSSVPSSPPCHQKRDNVQDSVENGSRKPNVGSLRKPSKNTMRINGVAKRLADVIEHKRPHINSSGTEVHRERWASQDSGFNYPGLADAMKPSRASLDHYDSFSKPDNEDIVVRKPPGLDKHCPADTLPELYPNGNAPRFNIEDMLKTAYKKNLIKDAYNARRLSIPTEGSVMPKAEVPKIRPPVGGPFCLMRRPYEHVMTYPVMEIDRAYKNKEIDDGFKIHIITRCIDADCAADVALADQFVSVTRKKQNDKDTRKEEHMKGKKYAEQAKRHKGEKESSEHSTDSNSSEEEPSHNPMQEIKNDPRYLDPHLKKYFFRQRISSYSRHPSHESRCPLLKGDLSASMRRQYLARQYKSSSVTDRPDVCNPPVASVDLSHAESPNISASKPFLVPSDSSSSMHGRCCTISAGSGANHLESPDTPSKQTRRSRSARSATVDKLFSKNTTSTANDDSHPTEYSLASSSTSSSSRSFDNESFDQASSEADNATLRCNADSMGSKP